jgi:hypothetical protein
MASNDNDKHKMEEEVESLMARKHLQHTDDDDGDDDSSDSSDSLEEESLEEEPEEEEEREEEEETKEEETSMNQLDTSAEKLYARRACGYLFGDNGDPPQRHWTHHPHRKVTGAPTRRAVTTTMMTSGCR